MPRKVIHLITSLGGGGTENYLHQLLSLSPASWENHVLYFGRDGVIGERIRKLGLKTTRLSDPWALCREIKEIQPDILHTCLYWAHQIGRWVGKKRLDVVSSHQAIDIWQKPWHRWIDTFTLPWCTCVVVNSAAANELIRSRVGHRQVQPRIVQIDNGLDFSRFQMKDRQGARQFFQLEPHMRIGGTLIRLHPEKGAEKIPALADAVLSAHADLVLMIGGTGPLEGQLRAATQKWGNRIRWVGWQDDTQRFLSSLDFFWLLSREESFPQALLEASGVGLPWVAPNVGSIKDLLSFGAAGLLYPREQLPAAVQSFSEMMQNLPAHTLSAQNAIPALKTRYSLDQMVASFYTLLDQLVEGKN